MIACTTSKAGGNPPPATGGSTGGTSGQQVAYSPDGRPIPAHRFTARAHEPHVMAAVAPLPPLPAMPRFVDGAARCFPRQDVYRPYPVPYNQYPGGSTKGGSGSGAGQGYGSLGSSSPSRSTASSASASPSKPKAAPEKRKDGYAAADSAAEGSAARPSTPSPAPAPPAASQAAPKQEAARGRAEAPTDKKAAEAESGPRYAAEPAPAVPPQRGPDWGASIYLSNDDTMSLSSAQRVLWAIDHYAPVSQSNVRPHELLNYFSFETGNVAFDHDFSVLANIAPSQEDPNLFTLGLSVQGRPLSTATRRNANLAYVIDRSGSMQEEGRMNYLKKGLLRSLKELKQGDIVHLVLFDTNTCDLAQNFVVGRDSMPRLEQLIQQIQPLGSTNLNDGLAQGYAAVDRTYQPTYTNRVVMITDAIANTGVTDEALIATVAKHYDDRKVRLSGVGVGSDFNDSLLDTLTERGKGAYVFLGSEAEVDAVFGSHFVSLIETVATDVHFRLHLPPSLAMQTFYGEEASTSKERVQAIHYFANTSQMFLSDLVSRDGRIPVQDDIMFTIEYQDPETGRARVEEFVWNLGNVAGRSPNLDKAMVVSRFARDLGAIAERPLPAPYYERAGGWSDYEAASRCSTTASELRRIGAGVAGDPEVQRVFGLWDRFCGRYVPPPVEYRPPTPQPQPPRDWPTQPAPVQRNNDYAPPDRWPGAR